MPFSRAKKDPDISMTTLATHSRGTPRPWVISMPDANNVSDSVPDGVGDYVTCRQATAQIRNRMKESVLPECQHGF
jgi:hypothetical protein